MAAMKRVFLIENPVASRARERGLERAVAALAGGGCGVTMARTSGPGDAQRLAQEAVAGGHHVIVVYGGDGTVMQAVAGMYGSDAVLGIIPAGTGNLLAGNLRLPRNPAKAAGVIAAGRARTIDLARLETSGGARFFAVGAGTGFDADMIAGTSTARKSRWGMGAYVGLAVRTAHRVRTTRVRVTVDGAGHDCDAAMVLVANCAEIVPPLLTLGNGIALDDGILDVVILETRGLAGIAMAVAGRFLGRNTRRLKHLRGKRILVETADPQTIQADGELCGSTPFLASIVPGGLRVIATDPRT